MSEPITSSICEVNASQLSEAPAFAMGTLYQSAGASAGIALQNAVHAQNGQYALNDATAVEGVNLLYLAPSAASAAAASKFDAAFESQLAKLGELLLSTRL